MSIQEFTYHIPSKSLFENPVFESAESSAENIIQWIIQIKSESPTLRIRSSTHGHLSGLWFDKIIQLIKERIENNSTIASQLENTKFLQVIVCSSDYNQRNATIFTRDKATNKIKLDHSFPPYIPHD